MQFNVSQLLREPVGSRRRYPIDESASALDPLDCQRDARITGDVNLLCTHRGVLVTASLTSRAGGECARCLQAVSYPVELSIEEEYFPSVDPLTGAVLLESEEPGALRIDERHTLDLTEAVRQAWVLAAPMRTLCSADCAGLCPVCGGDRNTGECVCNTAPVDARWASLAALGLRDNNGDNEES